MYSCKTIREYHIQLENNGKWSNHKRTRHIDIRLFFITYKITDSTMRVEYCPTDYMSKPLQGEKCRELRRKLMNLGGAATSS